MYKKILKLYGKKTKLQNTQTNNDLCFLYGEKMNLTFVFGLVNLNVTKFNKLE